MREFELRNLDWDDRTKEFFLKRDIRLLRELTGLQVLTCVLVSGFEWMLIEKAVGMSEGKTLEAVVEEAIREREEGVESYFQWLALECKEGRSVPRVEVVKGEQTWG